MAKHQRKATARLKARIDNYNDGQHINQPGSQKSTHSITGRRMQGSAGRPPSRQTRLQKRGKR